MQSKNEIQDKFMLIIDSTNIQTSLLKSYCRNHIKTQQDLDIIEEQLDSIRNKLNQLMSLTVQL